VLRIKDLEKENGYTCTRVFLQKSADLLENKRVEFFVSAKECGMI
jgi:hypothetical protein